jgi:hypothetical protein
VVGDKGVRRERLREECLEGDVNQKKPAEGQAVQGWVGASPLGLVAGTDYPRASTP